MGHNSSKEWIENLSDVQKKYLLKHHGGMFQISVTKFSNNEKDTLMKRYRSDQAFTTMTTQVRLGKNIEKEQGPGDWTFLD